MHQAEMAMLQDPEAGGVVGEFNAMRQMFDKMMARNEEPTDKQKKDAADVEARAESNPLIVKFFETQKAVEKLLEMINEEIGVGLAASACDSGDCDHCHGCS